MRIPDSLILRLSPDALSVLTTAIRRGCGFMDDSITPDVVALHTGMTERRAAAALRHLDEPAVRDDVRRLLVLAQQRTIQEIGEVFGAEVAPAQPPHPSLN